MKKLFTAATLVLALSAPAWAGTIAQPGYEDPPPCTLDCPDPDGTNSATTTETAILQAIIILLTSGVTTP